MLSVHIKACLTLRKGIKYFDDGKLVEVKEDSASWVKNNAPVLHSPDL